MDALRYMYLFELKIKINHYVDLLNVATILVIYYSINNNFGLGVNGKIIITYSTLLICFFYVLYFTDEQDLKTTKWFKSKMVFAYKEFKKIEIFTKF